MKKFLLLLVLVTISLTTLSQNNPQQNFSIRKNFHETRDKFLNTVDQTQSTSNDEEASDDILQKFRRWQFLLEQRTFPSGKVPDPTILWTEWSKYKTEHPETATLRTATWSPVGTAVVPSNGGGAGRINVMRFDPTNSNIIFIGSAGGGVWKTIDAGTTWSALSDGIPVLSIADIAIDATNHNNIWIATGDGYGYEFGSDNDFWGGLYSAGILKSTDGGATWSTTGLSFTQDAGNIIQRLVIHPTNSNILLAATRSGIYRTADAGFTWSIVNSNHCYDIEFKTTDANTIYAGGNNTLYKSTDAGVTWTTMKSSAGTGRISIEVSAASSLTIYSISESGSFYKSTDGGTTWSTKTFPSGAGFYGYYDIAFACSQTNADYLLAGGLNIVKSSNGGTSWTTANSTNSSSSNYSHADNHDLDFLPGSTSTFYAASDGGIFTTSNSGTSWTDKSNGLAISQIYRFSSGATDPNIIYSGWQDNGSNRWNGNDNTWKQVYGADGMDCMVDYTTTQTVYTS